MQHLIKTTEKNFSRKSWKRHCISNILLISIINVKQRDLIFVGTNDEIHEERGFN